MNAGDLAAILPLVAVWLVAFLVILVDVIVPGRDRLSSGIATVGALGAMAVTALVAPQAPHTAFGGAYILDQLTVLLLSLIHI